MKNSLLLILTAGYLFSVNAQTSVPEKMLNSQMTISTGVTSTSFKNDNVTDDEYKLIDKQNGINFGVSYTKYFKSLIGFSLGLNYATYSQKVYQKGSFEKVDQFDQDNEMYDLLLFADITESYSVGFLEIPLMVKVIIGKPEKIYGFVEGGVVYGMFLKKSYEKDGSLENKGRYSVNNPYFDLVSHNNNYYGHEKVVYTDVLEDVYAGNNLSGRIAFGISVVGNENITFNISPVYTFGISDIMSKDIQSEEYENIFNDKSDYRATKTSAFGFNFGIALTFSN